MCEKVTSRARVAVDAGPLAMDTDVLEVSEAEARSFALIPCLWLRSMFFNGSYIVVIPV